MEASLLLQNPLWFSSTPPVVFSRLLVSAFWGGSMASILLPSPFFSSFFGVLFWSFFSSPRHPQHHQLVASSLSAAHPHPPSLHLSASAAHGFCLVFRSSFKTISTFLSHSRLPTRPPTTFLGSPVLQCCN
jgi:hypothetical protein